MRFLIDAQLPPALARYLAELGHQAVHVADVGLASAADRDIWSYAGAHGAALITKDEDFVTMRALSAPGAPAVIWIRIGNATRRTLLVRLAPLWPAIIDALESGETIVQVPDR